MIDRIISETIENLNREKYEIEDRIRLIASIDWTKPVTEDEWHELCETSIRGSELVLGALVKSIFPEATDIVRSPNYVNFSLHGYSVQIPTSRCRGINIATDWYRDISYQKEHRGPVHSTNMVDLRNYFDAKDNHLGWKAEAKARLWNGHSDFWLFWHWFTKEKWRKIDRRWFEDMWELEELQFAENTQRIEQIEAQNREHLNFILANLMPELDKFSTEHYSYFGCADGRDHLTIKEILEKEGLNNGN